MPLVNISITGKTTSSASGVINDPDILAKLKEVQCHLQDESHVEDDVETTSNAIVEVPPNSTVIPSFGP